MLENNPAQVCRQTADLIENRTDKEWRQYIGYSFPKGVGHVVAYLHSEPDIDDHRTNDPWKKRQADRLGLTEGAFFNLRWCGGVNGGYGANTEPELVELLRMIADRHDMKDWNRKHPHFNRMREGELKKLASSVASRKRI